MSNSISHTAPPTSDNLGHWFKEHIKTLGIEILKVETKTADKATEQFLTALAEGDESFVISETRKNTFMYYIKNMLGLYLFELNQRNASYNKLAFDLGDATILVWAEIADDDESTHTALNLAEAKVNAYFAAVGFSMDTTVVEACDQLSIPPHYQRLTE